jgi:hypothetical protein
MNPTYQRYPASVHALSLPLSLPLPGGSGLFAPIRSRTRPFSLVARWDLPVSVERPFARSPSLAYGPRLSATTPSLTSRLRSPSWTHFLATSHAHEPLPAPTRSLPSPSCALSRTPSLSLSSYAHAPWSSVVIRHRSVAVVKCLPRPLPCRRPAIVDPWHPCVSTIAQTLQSFLSR